LVGLVEFENDVLDLTEKLKPLQSSHTQSQKAGGEEKSDEKDVEKTDTGDTSDEEGGRPALPQEQRSDKTM